MTKIAIVGWNVGDNSFGVTKSYIDFFSNFGEVTIIGPDETDTKDVNLLVLPGGKDVDPKRYGKKPHIYTSNPDLILENFDTLILPQYIEAKVPIFGICRGLQTLNVAFNGTLTQHLRTHKLSSKTRAETVHKVFRPEEYKKFKNNNKASYVMESNSLHHQAIDVLGEGLIVTLLAEDGVVEAIVHEELPISAVQHHPEEIWDSYSINEIERLLKL